MSSSFGLLGVESHDFSQVDKERTACKSEQIHKMTAFFTQRKRKNFTLILLTQHVLYLWAQAAWARAIVDERWVEDANQKYSRLR